MRHTLGRVVMLTCCATPFAFGVLATAACSKSGQERAATPAATAAPAAAPGAAPAAAPAATAAATDSPAPAKPIAPPPRRFTLAAGTVLAIRTTSTLSTDSQAAGDQFVASLAEPLVDGDWVVAKSGAEVEGLVVASTKGGRVKGRAELEVAVTALTLSDGQRIPLTTAVDATVARSTKGKDAKTIGITAGIGAAIGAVAGGGKGAAIGAAAGGAGGTALVLGTRGQPARIPARSLLRFKVTIPVEIVEKK